MANSSVTYTASGSTQTFNVTFPFISRSHVTVKVNGIATTNFTWDNDSQVTISSPTVVSGDTVKIERDSSINSSLVDWKNGDNLTESDLDTQRLQHFYLIQEIQDEVDDLSVGAVDPFNALTDTDGDTKIQAEESSDEDILRFDIAGTQDGRWDATGLVIGDLDSAPDGKLHIHKGTAGVVSAHADGDDLIIEDSSISGMTFLAGTSGSSVINFGDANDNASGQVKYDHSDNTLILDPTSIIDFNIGGTFKGRWDTTGLSIGQDVTGDGPLHIGAGLAGAVTANANGDELVVEGPGNTGISILSPVANRSSIFLGNPNSNERTEIRHEGTTEGLNISTHATDRLNIGSSEVVWNDPGNDLNHRMEGDTDPNLFFLDAGLDTIVLGSATGDASALLDMVSTTKGLGLPSMTTTQRDNISTPRDGLLIYNSTNDVLNARANGAWVALDTGSMQLTRETVQASTSGTSIDFTGLPAGANRVTVVLNNVSTNGTDDLLIQLGDSGGLETTGYVSSSEQVGGTHITSTAGIVIDNDAAASAWTGNIVFTRSNSNNWIASYTLIKEGGNPTVGGGRKALSAELDRVSITTTGGTNTFDLGEINVYTEV